ncbi:GNAT family N-acetyltransferase [Miniphocaeibacter massiliensis]|uniref:GNAT family N-acetyltransferase n=1 Tax=Miniphocaeibacter massiliensis TaxID=2041841 RepID=UPI000C086DA6|nr:GNAT family N-acetyltransferase [Miniphocaeibacter massiliensis]
MENSRDKLIIEKDGLKLKKLEFEDAINIKNWGRHNNELLIDYELGNFTKNQLRIWYISKKSGIKNKYFAIYNEEDKMIGYLGMKNIALFKRTSTLGIVLDPNYVSKGYGYKSLKLFLNYYFDTLNMKEMDLEVNAFNERALKLYKKIGFKYTAEYYGMFENQKLDFSLPNIEKYRDCFIVNRGIIYSKNYVMNLSRKRFMIGENKNEI